MNQPSLHVSTAPCASAFSVATIATSFLSLISYCYIIGSYYCSHILKRHPGGIMVGMSVYGVSYQLFHLLYQLSPSLRCSQTIVAYFMNVMLFGQENYMLVFALDLLLVIKNPFSISVGQQKKYHVFCCFLSLLLAAIASLDTKHVVFGFCWMTGKSTDADRPDSAQPIHFFIGSFFALYIVIVYCALLFAIFQTWGNFMHGLPNTFRSRRRTQRNAKYYVGSYFGYWTIVLSCYALFRTLSHPPYHSAIEKKTADDLYCLSWRVFCCVLLGKGLVAALIWTRTANVVRILRQIRESGFVDVPSTEDSIDWALRLEILTHTTNGICRSSEIAENLSRVSTFHNAMVVQSGLTLASAYHLYDSDTMSDPCEDKQHFAHVEKIILGGEAFHRPKDVLFLDYAPLIFRHLRRLAKISCAEYRHSFQQSTKERVSEGKSGAFFYFTQDQKYAVKTMRYEELQCLLRILPHYCNFVKNHPSTLLTRFFGCHAVQMYGKTVYFMVMQSVFNTCLPIHERFDLKGSWVGRLESRKRNGTSAICKYCSKAYIVGGSKEQMCINRRGEGSMRHQYDQVGKDLNWNRSMTSLVDGAEDMATQLYKDSEFLCAMDCIDYSLLIGIHHSNLKYSSEVEGNNLKGLNVPGRVSSKNGSWEVGATADTLQGSSKYYVGLIDILQPWNFKKRVERFLRVRLLLQDRHGISVMCPRKYATRFQQRVVKELIYDNSVVNQARQRRSHLIAPSAQHEADIPNTCIVSDMGATAPSKSFTVKLGEDPSMLSVQHHCDQASKVSAAQCLTFLRSSCSSRASLSVMVPSTLPIRIHSNDTQLETRKLSSRSLL